MRATTPVQIFLTLILALTSLMPAPAAARQLAQKPASLPELSWPPPGQPWETEPTKAFARAQREHKLVFLLVCTTGCPHCNKLAHQTWGNPALAWLRHKLVLLAAHGSRPTDGATLLRMNTMTYPSMFLLGSQGQILNPNLRRDDPRELSLNLQRVLAHQALPEPLKPLQLSAGLLARVPGAQRQLAVNPNPYLHDKVWLPLIPKLSLEQALELWQRDPDPVIQLAILDRLASIKPMPRTLPGYILKLIRHPNMHIKKRAINYAVTRRYPGTRETLEAELTLLLLPAAQTSGNTNVVRSMLVKGLGELGEAASTPLLARVMTYDSIYNHNQYMASEALFKIWQRHHNPEAARALVRGIDRELPADMNKSDKQFFIITLRELSAIFGEDLTALPIKDGIARSLILAKTKLPAR
ncbi:MAG TPA: hypothetical protein V6D23_13900 [Candidatus Obscuribacterales bacterium]